MDRSISYPIEIAGTPTTARFALPNIATASRWYLRLLAREVLAVWPQRLGVPMITPAAAEVATPIAPPLETVRARIIIGATAPCAPI